MQITNEKMEETVLFLSQTDQEMARLKALTNGLDRQTKTIKAQAFMRSGESSVSAREQAAYLSPDYRRHLERLNEAEYEMMTLQEQRNTAIVVIDCWRSLNASRRAGNV